MVVTASFGWIESNAGMEQLQNWDNEEQARNKGSGVAGQ